MSTLRMTPAALREPAVRYAVGALVVAVVLLGVAIVGAVRVDTVQAAAPNATIADSALRFRIPGAGPDIAGAVASDLFTDDRRAPARRYLMPGEEDAGVQAPVRPAVLGTALAADGAHFAIAQIAGAQPRVVRVGDRLGEYTVLAIERGKVTFRGPDGERFTIDAAKPVP